ncbi:MAG: flagellin, partial [Burkholderiaceae bacterium]
AVTGRVVINGVTSPTFSTIMNNTRASRIAAVEAINRISDITGVVAVNSNSESEGISLVAKDGRNIEVSFDTPDSAADFSARTGLREGVQAGTFSLESRVEGPIVISTSATGNVHNAGLTLGDYTANVSTMSTVTPAVVPGDTLPVALGTGDLVINGVPIRGATAADDKFTERAALLTTSNVSTGSGIAFANAVNASSELTGVTATPNPVVAQGTKTIIDPTTTDGFKSLFVNGVDVRVEFKATHTASERVQAVINAVNPLTGPTGVTASANLQGGVTFTTLDGRNLSVWFDDTDVSAAEFGLAVESGANADGVSGKSTAPTLANASTLYGGVTFHSAKAFTIEPGGNGYGPNSNFTALGLTEGTFGGVVDSAVSKMTPPNTGRLSFHVGASANQIITIDLSDFGDGGTITSDITGDVDLWDSDKRVNRIDTASAASATLEKLDAVMDKVNGTRATMGAVMNRLEHVIDNLMNVSMNTEASRSQIEDADYAAASTELARTQIMQQAATSVLAQANADQQNVLKLLQ